MIRACTPQRELIVFLRQLRFRHSAGLGQMCLSFETIEPPEAMIVASPLSDRASVFSMCFPEEIPDYDLPMDLGDGSDGVILPDTYMDEMDMIDTGYILDTAPCGSHYAFDMFGVSMIDSDEVTLYDACTDEMDMIGTGRILDASPPGPRSAFDVFGISMLEFDGDGLVATDITHDTVSGEGVSDSVDPPLSLTLCPDDPLSGQSECDSDSDTEDRKVSPISGSTELIDFEVPDQSRELKIGSFLSPDERSRLIDLLRSYLDVFAWSYEDMPGLDPTIVQHHLPILPHARPWLANVISIPKKDDNVRVCVDFRDLNKASPKDDFFLSHIDVLVDSIAGHLILSFMDGFSGYAFGLKNAGATYQRAATTLFHDIMHRDVEVDHEKIRAILDMPTPRTEREIRGFLGRLQYTSLFIARLTNICEPIFHLLRKNNLQFGMMLPMRFRED
ncbi:hypothetical protein CK203_093618 [Vitis vinifera]|uniref:Transposon Ty3-I Gag-Pol polyprotein n=1 Tax=Vitis vinifera TaxID=29760 RepID=A0A438DJT0_VITVI|nr:hypothetical protein CK203_093618 [Vitis vinifera]